MATQHLDLEEQEQLDQLKAFWKQYGNLITTTLIVVFGALAAYNGWQYWQRSQATQAATLFDEVERAVLAGDTTKVERTVADMRDKFGRTTLAQQASLLAAKHFQDKNNAASAKASLNWVLSNSSDDAYQALAKLRLSGLQYEEKAFDEASKTLTGSFPPEFAALVSDRRADVLLAQGKREEAKAEFEKAYKCLDERAPYRKLVEVKLNALGVDPTIAEKQAAEAAAKTAAKDAPAATTAAKDAPAAPKDAMQEAGKILGAQQDNKGDKK
jgi:predicted negative regulator of RcsB-dependent stress response